jgi:hypothetical protein
VSLLNLFPHEGKRKGVKAGIKNGWNYKVYSAPLVTYFFTRVISVNDIDVLGVMLERILFQPLAE